MTFNHFHLCFVYQGPVGQSIVSLMKFLVENLLILTVFTKTVVVIFLLKNCEKLLQFSLHFFGQKLSVILPIICLKI